MQIKYEYKDKTFEDIRDIVHNNNLDIDFQYIFEEYLPFQALITGKTFFKGLTIRSSAKYNPSKYVKYQKFDNELFQKSIQNYLKEYDFDFSKEFTCTVSGGVDSSIIALITKPKSIYSGRYIGEAFYDETEYSKLIAHELEAIHYIYDLTENDFLENMDDCLEITCSPIAGMGSIMEYATLKKALKDMPNTKQVLFGNGGDEIFMGYFFNYYVKEFYEKSYEFPNYMPNFLASKRDIAEKLIDFMIVASLNRSSLSDLYSPFVINKFIPMINSIKSIVDKLLFVNINITLPTLLHLNNQFCRALNVKGFNPLANNKLIEIAKHINTPMTQFPKEYLRNICDNMPKQIKENYIKRGFPIPTNNWHNLNHMMRNAYNSFFKRSEVVVEKIPYNNINRYSWGIFQAELCLRRFDQS